MRKLVALSCFALSTAQAQARWTGKVDLAIGGPDETRDAYMLNYVSGLLIDGAGRIVVAQMGDNTVRVFSSTGSHLYTFGRAGSGPGDLAGPCCLAVDKADRLWIGEMRNRRHSVYSVDDAKATFVTSYPVRPGSGPLDRRNWNADGAILYLTTESFRAGPIRTVRFHADTTGKEIRRDTLRDPPVDSSTMVYVHQVVAGGRSTYMTHVGYAPRFIRAEGPGGVLAEAFSQRYEVDWIGGDMKPLRTITASFEPPALSAREKAAVRDSLTDFATKMKANIDLDAVRIPTRKPAIANLGFDLDGRLWVERSVADGQPRGADVYDGRGTLVARATWPNDVVLRFSTIRGSTGLGIRTDEATDLPSVVRVTFAR